MILFVDACAAPHLPQDTWHALPFMMHHIRFGSKLLECLQYSFSTHVVVDAREVAAVHDKGVIVDILQISSSIQSFAIDVLAYAPGYCEAQPDPQLVTPIGMSSPSCVINSGPPLSPVHASFWKSLAQSI